jgi:hypothetical protein
MSILAAKIGMKPLFLAIFGLHQRSIPESPLVYAVRKQRTGYEKIV